MTDKLRQRAATITEARRAIACLSLEVPEAVARNVADKVEALIFLLQTERTPEWEPMAWMQKDEVGQEWLSTHVWKCPTTPMEYDNMVPLYRHPPMREPPVLHERTPRDDGWICCCGDHLLDDTFPGREEADETPEEYTARYELWRKDVDAILQAREPDHE